MEREDDAQEQRFLPPEPAGPEPDLAHRPQDPPPEPPQPTYGYPPPPPGYQQPPPGYQQPPPPGYGGYQAPPPGWGHPPQWAWQPPVPDNGQAVAGFVFSIVAVGLLFISAGLSTVVSIGCAITGIVCSRNGKRRVARGETPKHKGLAQAGFIIGWVALGLSILATLFWILAIAGGLVDEGSGGSPGEVRRIVAVAVGG